MKLQDNQHRFSFWYFLILFFALMAFQDMLGKKDTAVLAYSEFKQLLKAGNVDAVLLGERSIEGTLNLDRSLPEGLAAEQSQALSTLGGGTHPFVAARVDDPGLVAELDAAKVPYSAKSENHWLSTLLSWVLPAVFFVGLWSIVLRRMGGGAGGMLEIGKSKAKVYVESDTQVTFEDVAGVDEAKQELQEVVEFLKDPSRYGRLGAHIPRGVLLVGPPGTGKTLLARAVAGQAGVPFFSISGSEFVEMFVGVGAARVRDLFEQARQQAPAIIFIDELDALGRARGANPLMSHDEKEQTLNQLLVEMDGFDPSSGLVLLAATNRPEILDPALLRAGRFDRQILVDRPDKLGRVQILQVHLKKVQLEAGVDPAQIAALTPGFSGADLANLVNEAALLATRRDAQAIGQEDFTQAIERLVAGLEKKQRLLNVREREAVAFHEMGHALVAMALPDVDPVQKVSIIPRGIGALGYTLQRPTEDRFLMTQSELEQRMTVLMGGRAAEQLVLGRLSTGAADDLAKATDIARNMVMRFGMDPTLGHVAYEEERNPLLQGPLLQTSPRSFSEATSQHIDEAVRALVQAAFERALELLRQQSALLQQGAQQLLAKETLVEAELKQLWQTRRTVDVVVG